jgi:hypothetical protein
MKNIKIIMKSKVPFPNGKGLSLVCCQKMPVRQATSNPAHQAILSLT